MEWFGEVAVIRKCARSATVKAKGKVVMFAIEAELFMQFVFPLLEEKFMAVMESYQ